MKFMTMGLGVSLTMLVLGGCGAQDPEEIRGIDIESLAPEQYRAGEGETSEWRTAFVGDRMIAYQVIGGEVVTQGDITWGSVEEFEAQFAASNVYASKFKDGGQWNMPIKYKFADGTPQHVKDAVHAAMARLIEESNAVISFDTCSICLSSHIKFKYNGNGCSSPVGKQLLVNIINLDTWCDDMNDLGRIMHEIMHSLGVFHEQQRCDRNNYVSILYDNIEDGESQNFWDDCWNSTDHGDYDFDSVMHYSAYAFSKNGSKTITAHDPTNDSRMGQRAALSPGDAAGLRAKYGIAYGGSGTVGGTPPPSCEDGCYCGGTGGICTSTGCACY